jgi:putative hemolysin
MTALLLAALLAAFICVGGLFTGLESAQLALNRITIRRDRLHGIGAAHDVYRTLTATQSVIFTSTVAQSVCVAGAAISAVLVAHQLYPCGPPGSPGTLWRELLVLLVLTPVYLAVARIAPKYYFARHPVSALLRLLEPILWVPRLVSPVIPALGGPLRTFVSNRLRASSTRRIVKLTPDDLRQLLDPRGRAAPAETIDKRMIYGIFGLEQTIVREIMQPLVNVAAIQRRELTVDGVLALSRESGYSRIPVYTGRIFNMDGIVEVPLLLRATPPVDPGDFIRPPCYVPETLRADVLLQKMIAEEVALAIVVDEYGGTVGVVSREDVIEEIVGDIEDEFDPNRPMVQEEPDGSLMLDGRMDVDDLNDRFGMALPNEDFDTLGGYLYHMLGRVPRVGDTVAEDTFHFEVTTMDGKRVERVKMRLHRRAEDDAPSMM